MESFIADNFEVILIASLWQLAWTGYGLWLSARAEQWKWFLAMLFLNTLGILEILYIFIFNKSEDNYFRKK